MQSTSIFFMFGMKQLLNNKRFSIPVILSLGITVGILIGAVSIANSNILKPIRGVPNAMSLSSILIYNEVKPGINFVNLTSRKEIASFMQEFAVKESAFVFESTNELATYKSTPLKSNVYNAHFAMFNLLGTKALKGINLTNENYQAGVWISNSLYQRELNKGVNLLNSAITVGQTTQNILGVVEDIGLPPKLMKSVDAQASIYNQIWYFNDFSAPLKDTRTGSSSSLYLDTKKTRLPDEDTIFNWFLSQAEEEDREFYSELLNKPNSKVSHQTFRERVLPSAHKMSVFMLLSAILLTFIAVVNIMNLFSAYYTARYSEFSLRLISGARKHDIRKQLWVESSPLILLSFALAMITAHLFVESLSVLNLQSLNANGTPTISIALYSLLFFSILLSFYIGLRLAIWKVNERNLNAYIQSSGKGVNPAYHSSITKYLVALQIALTIMFSFAGSAVAYINFQIAYTDLGFQTENIHNVTIKTEDQAWIDSFNDENYKPYASNAFSLRNSIKQVIQNNTEDVEVINLGQGPISESININVVDSIQEDGSIIQVMYSPMHTEPGYLKEAGFTFLAGQDITEQQFIQNEKVAIANERYARLVYPNTVLADVIGQPTYPGASSRIIGVVNDHHTPPNRPEFNNATLFKPSTWVLEDMRFVIKTKDTFIFEEPKVLKQIKAQFPQIKSIELQSYDVEVNNRTNHQRIVFYTSLALVVFTTLLAVIGISGLTILTTKQNAYELAIRMTQGATRIELLFFMLKSAGIMLAVGAIFGAFASVWVYDFVDQNLSANLPPFNWPSLIILVTLSSIIYLTSVIIPTWKIVANRPLAALKAN